MAKELEIPELPSVDNIFKLSTNKGKTETVVMIELNKISNFPNHPFQVRDDNKMMETVASVKKNGVLIPVIIRPKENGEYEMIAGHRRKRACEIAEIETLPCIIRNLNDDEATILMVDSNVQREEILPSERAFAYKMKLEALKHQGKQIQLEDDTTSTTKLQKLSIDIIAEEFGQSREEVRKYIRLTYLNKDLLKKVDEKSIALKPAVQISYLTQEEQYMLLDAINSYQATPTENQVKEMREISKLGKLTQDVVDEIMEEEKPNQKEKYIIHYEKFEKYLPRDVVTTNEVENYLLKLAERDYKRQHQMQYAR